MQIGTAQAQKFLKLVFRVTFIIWCALLYESAETIPQCLWNLEQGKVSTVFFSDLNIKLKDFEANLAQKVQQVEDRFWRKAEGMLSEKTDLKRRYNHKCNELFALKAELSGVATQRSVR